MSQGDGSTLQDPHRLVAAFSQRALQEDDPRQLMQEACRAATRALGVEHGLVLEAVPGEEEAIPREAIGWPREMLGKARVPAGAGTATGQVLEEGRPLQLEQARAGNRFGRVLGLSRHDVTDGIVAPIGSRERPWGVLEAYTRTPRSFTQAEVDAVEAIANILAMRIEAGAREGPGSGHAFEVDAEEILGRVTDAFYALDEGFCFTHVNEAAAEILQRSREELLGENLWEMFPEAAQLEEVWDAFHTAMERQETTGYEVFYPPLDVWVDTTVYPSESGVSVYFRDVTERKERERRLRESEARFRTVAENLDEVVWMTTEDPDQMVYVNPKFEDVWGMDRETLYEDSGVFVASVHPEDRDRVEQAYYGLPEDEYDLEYRVVRPDGDERWIHAHAVRVHDAEGRVHRIVGIAEDVTERRTREQRLQEEKAKFQSIVSEVEEYAIFMLDPQGKIQSWNTGAKRLHGYTEDEILGESIRVLYTEEERDAGLPQRDLETALEEDSTQDEGWCLRKDGSRFWASVTITPLRDDDGTLGGFSKVVRDMTQRRRQERRLAVSEQRHRTLVENFPDGAVGLFDEDLRYTLVGGSIFDELDISPEETIGQTVWERYPEPVARKLAPKFEKVFEGRSDAFEMDYHGRWWVAHLIPIRGPDGDVNAGMIVVQDITDRKRVENKLRESQELYRTLIENFPNGAVALVDRELRYRIAGGSPVVETVQTGRELEGKRVAEALPGPVAEAVVPRYEAALKGESSRFEHQHDGRFSQFHIFPVRDEHGEVLYAMGMSQDITQRREYEHRLEESNKHLEQFAYAASHDLQEPLRMISTYLQMIETRYIHRLDDDAEEFFEYVIDGAQRMRAMIQSLLQYSRVAQGGPSLERTDANRVLEDVLNDLRLKIDETDAEVRVEELPVVKADPDQLGQVFRNLIANALTYRGDQRPRVSVSAERTPFRWVFTVEDEGVGVPEAYAEKIFEVFEQIPHGEEASGTGVGLAICQQIVERHGGRIWVDSEPGQGARFSFTMPPVEPG